MRLAALASIHQLRSAQIYSILNKADRAQRLAKIAP